MLGYMLSFTATSSNIILDDSVRDGGDYSSTAIISVYGINY